MDIQERFMLKIKALSKPRPIKGIDICNGKKTCLCDQCIKNPIIGYAGCMAVYLSSGDDPNLYKGQ